MYDITTEKIDPIIVNYIGQNFTNMAATSLYLSIGILEKYTNNEIQDICINHILSDDQFTTEELNRSVRGVIESHIDILTMNIGIELTPNVPLMLKCGLIIGISNLLTEDNIPMLAGIIESNANPVDVLVTAIPLVSTITLVQTTQSINSVSMNLLNRISKIVSSTDANKEYEYPAIDNKIVTQNLKILSKLYSDYRILAVDVLRTGTDIGLDFEDYLVYLKNNAQESEEGKYLAVFSLLLISINGSVLPSVVFEATADRIFLDKEDIKKCADFISRNMLVLNIERKKAQQNFNAVSRM